jgi:sorbitol/mannitol transport system permease protein
MSSTTSAQQAGPSRAGAAPPPAMSGWTVRTLPLIAPSVGVLLIWMIVPLAMTLWFSFRRYNLVNPMLHGWAGTRNYYYLLTDPALYWALWITLVLVALVLIVTVCLGTLMAVLFNEPFPGRGIARVLVISPFFVMPTVSALIWKNMMMHPVNGLFAFIARSVGLRPIDWFGDLPLTSIIIICSWEWAPFAFLILLTALQSLDEQQKEAARIDGAGPISMFFYIIVPHLRRATSVVIMIETIFFLAIFAEIYVTTSGGPGIATTNIAFLIYQRALLEFNVGTASAAGVIAIVLANIVAVFLVRTVARNLES